MIEYLNLLEKYACIGRYVVGFENIVERIRFEICGLFQAKGLKAWSLSEIVLGQKQFTAGPLITCYESICYELLKDKDDTEQILNGVTSFKNKFLKQVGFRNDLVHSWHSIGMEAPLDMMIRKNSPTKMGSRQKVIAHTMEDVDKNTRELNQLFEEFQKISSNIKKFMLLNEN